MKEKFKGTTPPQEGREIADTTITLSPGERENLILAITKLFCESNINGVLAYDLNQIFKGLTGADHPNYKGDWSPDKNPFNIRK